MFSIVAAHASEPTADWNAVIRQQKASHHNYREKTEALVGQMTLLEKLSLYSMSSTEIKWLGIPAYNWWNEAVHGVARISIKMPAELVLQHS